MKSFSIKESLKFGFDTFKKQGWMLAGLTLVALLPSIISEGLNQDAGQAFFGHGAAAVLGLLVTIISIILSVGLINVGLIAERGEKVNWADLTSKARLAWPFFLASVVFAIAVVVGLILLIVPGIIILVGGSLFVYLLVDREMGPIESIKESWELTKGVRWKLLGFIIIAQLINLVGFLLVGIGLLVTVPVTTIAYAHVYRTLQNDRDNLPAVETPNEPARTEDVSPEPPMVATPESL